VFGDHFLWACDLKVLLTSGFAKKHDANPPSTGKFTDSLKNQLLRKPYTQRELAAAIHNLFGASGERSI
jgi:hypothetical protein